MPIGHQFMQCYIVRQKMKKDMQMAGAHVTDFPINDHINSMFKNNNKYEEHR